MTSGGADQPAWANLVGMVLSRHPAVGLAVGVLRDGRCETVVQGHANLRAGTPVSAGTVFRIASITKTMTAIAVMQLREAGQVDLDAPAGEYLRAYRLVPRHGGLRPPTLRHLLTHTAGIPDAHRLSDVLHFSVGAWDARPPILSVPFGVPLPALTDHYRHGLEYVAEPASAFAYSNPSFATLGQIVEDVSGLPLDRYFRERIFEPLGMTDSDLVRTPRLADRLAVGYAVRRRGARPVPDRDWIGAGGGGAYSTLRDLLRYVDALLHDGANAHGRVLAPASLAEMFEHQFETSAALPAMGLGFFVSDQDGHRVAAHDGVLPGFNAHLAVAPDDAVAVVALTNGSAGAMRWLPAEMDRLLGTLLALPEAPAAPEIPPHPEVWPRIAGRYVLPPAGDLRGKLVLGAGLEVFVRGEGPRLRLRLPAPALWRGAPLQPADAMDPMAFRLDLTASGLGGVQLRFAEEPGTGRKVMHTDLGGQPITFVQRGTARRPDRIERLRAEDQLMLNASRSWPQDIGALAILDGAGLFDAEGKLRMHAIRSRVASRLSTVPRLRQLIRTPKRGRGGPYWADDPAFDVARHVTELRLEPPVGEDELLRAVEELRSQRFGRRSPLWHIWFLTGLPEGRIAMFVKLHHTIGDGLAAMTIMSTFLDAEEMASPTASQPWAARSAPRPSELVADNLRQRLAGMAAVCGLLLRPMATLRRARSEWPSVRELLAEPPGDVTSLNRFVGPGRRLALVRASYRTIRRIARANDASVNDVLLSATTAGVRRLLLDRGERVQGATVRTYVPVTLRHRLRGPQQGNQLAQMAVPLALDEMRAVERLARVVGETKRRKAMRRPSLGALFRGRLATKLLLKAIVAQRVNLTTACVPGPRRPAYFAGARVLQVFPVLPLIGNEPIGVGAVSYADGFDIGITADADAVPDIEVLATGVREELARMAEESSVQVGRQAVAPGG